MLPFCVFFRDDIKRLACKEDELLAKESYNMVSHTKLFFEEDVIGLFNGKEKTLFHRGDVLVVWTGRDNKNWSCFRRKILKERGRLCEVCGSKGELHIHHIVPVSKNPSLIYDKMNCIVLCVSCHKQKHAKKIEVV